MKIKKYFYGKENTILILLSLAVIFLILKDIPFLNIIFPNYATISVLFVVASFLLGWYKNFLFYVLLVFITVVSYFAGSVSQTEQLAILTFFILSIFIIERAVQLFKDES